MCACEVLLTKQKSAATWWEIYEIYEINIGDPFEPSLTHRILEIIEQVVGLLRINACIINITLWHFTARGNFHWLMAFMYPHMSRWWPITNMAPSHHLNWCGIFIRKTFRHFPGRAVSQYKLHSIITNWLTWLNYTFNIEATCQGPISYKEAYEYKMAPPQHGQFILLNPLNRHPLGKPWWHDTGHPLWV